MSSRAEIPKSLANMWGRGTAHKWQEHPGSFGYVTRYLRQALKPLELTTPEGVRVIEPHLNRERSRARALVSWISEQIDSQNGNVESQAAFARAILSEIYLRDSLNYGLRARGIQPNQLGAFTAPEAIDSSLNGRGGDIILATVNSKGTIDPKLLIDVTLTPKNRFSSPGQEKKPQGVNYTLDCGVIIFSFSYMRQYVGKALNVPFRAYLQNHIRPAIKDGSAALFTGMDDDRRDAYLGWIFRKITSQTQLLITDLLEDGNAPDSPTITKALELIDIIN